MEEPAIKGRAKLGAGLGGGATLGKEVGGFR